MQDAEEMFWNATKRIEKNIEAWRDKNTPIRYFLLERHIIAKYSENGEIAYAIFNIDGSKYGNFIVHNLEECFLILALHLNSNDFNIVNLLLGRRRS